MSPRNRALALRGSAFASLLSSSLRPCTQASATASGGSLALYLRSHSGSVAGAGEAGAGGMEAMPRPGWSYVAQKGAEIA